MKLNENKNLTIISHIYNEEYLLPWWLKHHKDIADHGIIIDYHSTDRSLEIVKEICPDWIIITSRNEKFQADLVDAEVMDIESTIDGFKLCLNVTEFLVPKEDINILFDNQLHNIVYRIRRAAMIDNDETNIPLPEESLVEKKNFGCVSNSFEELAQISDGLSLANFRFAHNYTSGEYTLGRHSCCLPNIVDIDSLIYYYQFAPWTTEFIARKLQIKQNIPESDKAAGRGLHHFLTYEDMLSVKQKFLEKSSIIN
jgi:hypothetical protein